MKKLLLLLLIIIITRTQSILVMELIEVKAQKKPDKFMNIVQRMEQGLVTQEELVVACQAELAKQKKRIEKAAERNKATLLYFDILKVRYGPDGENNYLVLLPRELINEISYFLGCKKYDKTRELQKLKD